MNIFRIVIRVVGLLIGLGCLWFVWEPDIKRWRKNRKIRNRIRFGSAQRPKEQRPPREGE